MGRAVAVGETDGLLDAEAELDSLGDGVALGASDVESFGVDALDGSIARSRDSSDASTDTSGVGDCEGADDALARGDALDDALDDDALSDALALADASTSG